MAMIDLRDISNEKLLLELKARMLEKDNYTQQVHELNLALKEVNRKLNDSEALKSHFISNISNELINPFTSVLAITENILGVEKENWKQVIHMVSLIHTEVFNLDFQLKNIFAAAKLEAGEIQPEITLINIDQLIKNIIEFFKYEARRRQLSIEYVSENFPSGNGIYFKSDAEKIHLILSNLLSNAIKFSYTEGKVIIKAVKKENALILNVIDHGQGISKANEQIIFDRFKRVDTGINSLNRGHGLGLSIIKSIIDMLDGKIEFTSSLGKGTTFQVIFLESDKETSGVSTDADEVFFKEEQF
jgi:signal transduction histidine kinase